MFNNDASPDTGHTGKGLNLEESLEKILKSTKMFRYSSKFIEEQKRLEDSKLQEARKGSGIGMSPLEKDRIVKRMEESTLKKYIIGKSYYPVLLGHEVRMKWSSEPSRSLIQKTFPQFDAKDVQDFYRGYYCNG